MLHQVNPISSNLDDVDGEATSEIPSETEYRCQEVPQAWKVGHPSDTMYYPKQTEAQLFSAEPLLIYGVPAELLSQQPSPHYMFPCEQKPSGHKMTKENMSSGIRTSHLGIRYNQQPFKNVFSVAEPLHHQTESVHRSQNSRLPTWTALLQGCHKCKSQTCRQHMKNIKHGA